MCGDLVVGLTVGFSVCGDLVVGGAGLCVGLVVSGDFVVGDLVKGFGDRVNAVGVFTKAAGWCVCAGFIVCGTVGCVVVGADGFEIGLSVYKQHEVNAIILIFARQSVPG